MTVVPVPANAHGLCTAWSHHGLPVGSTGYAHLLTEVHGTDADIAAWCAPHLTTHVKHEDPEATDDSRSGSDDANEGDSGSSTERHGDGKGTGHGGSGKHHSGATSGSDAGQGQGGDSQDDGTGSGSHWGSHSGSGTDD